MPKQPDLDALLRDYIGVDGSTRPEPEPEPEPQPEPGQAAAALLDAYLKDEDPGDLPEQHEPDVPPEPAEPIAPPEDEVAAPEVAAPDVGALDDLPQMLNCYLEVDEAVAPGPDFALPRCAEVDELLVRYALDGEDVEQELAASLEEHLRQAEGSTQMFSGSPLQWRQVTATRVRDIIELEERTKVYALAYVERDQLAYDDGPDWDDETIKGVPPPNAPPIPPRARPGRGR